LGYTMNKRPEATEVDEFKIIAAQKMADIWSYLCW
jgi:hypothetical protein